MAGTFQGDLAKHISEQAGTDEELIAAEGAFYRLAQRQLL
jgi:hypothetical protein